MMLLVDLDIHTRCHQVKILHLSSAALVFEAKVLISVHYATSLVYYMHSFIKLTRKLLFKNIQVPYALFKRQLVYVTPSLLPFDVQCFVMLNFKSIAVFERKLVYVTPIYTPNVLPFAVLPSLSSIGSKLNSESSHILVDYDSFNFA